MALGISQSRDPSLMRQHRWIPNLIYLVYLGLPWALACSWSYLSMDPRHQTYDVSVPNRKIDVFNLGFDAQITDFDGYGYLNQHLWDPRYQKETKEYFERELRSAGLMSSGDQKGVELRCWYVKAEGTFLRKIYYFSSKISMEMQCCIKEIGWCDVFRAEGVGSFQHVTSMNEANARAQEGLVRGMIPAVAQQLR